MNSFKKVHEKTHEEALATDNFIVWADYDTTARLAAIAYAKQAIDAYTAFLCSEDLLHIDYDPESGVQKLFKDTLE